MFCSPIVPSITGMPVPGKNNQGCSESYRTVADFRNMKLETGAMQRPGRGRYARGGRVVTDEAQTRHRRARFEFRRRQENKMQARSAERERDENNRVVCRRRQRCKERETVVLQTFRIQNPKNC